MKFSGKFFLLLSVISILIFSCQRDSFVKETDIKLNFSVDTVLFDTVFTTIGSVTKSFTVRNTYSKPILISSIILAKGQSSNFRINVNGTPGNAKDIVIGANDSLYIFVEVTVNPDRDEMVEQDSIIFNAGGVNSDIDLVAYGQDVYLINGYVLKSQTLTNEKPYLIYNSAAVDSNAVLTIEAGVHLYFHRGSGFYVWGSLQVNGTKDNPVIFEGDRLEHDYFDVPGQWEGIRLSKISKNNVINYAEIYNAVIGIQVDSTQNDNPQLSIHNSKIEHHSFAGIYAHMSNIFATNCVFADCGYYSFAAVRGGVYDFNNCTFANYWRNKVRQTPSIVLNNYYESDDIAYLYDLKKAYFGNCIIWGNIETEIGIDDKYSNQGAEFNYLFDNCIIKYDEKSKINLNNTNHFIDISIPKEFNFADYLTYNFEQDSVSSSAQNTGKLEIINKYPDFLNLDINGISRTSDSGPDIGAYEKQ